MKSISHASWIGIAGDADPAKMQRPRIARTLSNNTSLMRRLQDAKVDRDGCPYWNIENDRVSAVISKLGRCHDAFECNEPRLEQPEYVDFRPLGTMSETARQAFEGSYDVAAAWPEVGKFLVHGNDATLSAQDMALGYKQMLRVEQAWHDIKGTLDMRPVFHLAPHRIHAHVAITVLSLLL